MDARTRRQANSALCEIKGKANSASLIWGSTIKFFRQTTHMKLILKAILAPELPSLRLNMALIGLLSQTMVADHWIACLLLFGHLPSMVEAVGGRLSKL